jgi:hypothetical protein
MQRPQFVTSRFRRQAGPPPAGVAPARGGKSRAGKDEPPEDDLRRGDLDGDALDLQLARVEALNAAEVTAERSVVGRIRARYVRLRQSPAGIVLGRDVELRQSAGLVLAATELNVERSAGQWLIGGLVQARQVFAVAVVAGRIEGQVKCLFDARGAFAFGAGAALMTGLLRLLTRRKG